MSFKAENVGYNRETTGPREAELVMEVPSGVPFGDVVNVAADLSSNEMVQQIRATLDEKTIRFLAKRFTSLVESWDAPDKGYYGTLSFHGESMVDVDVATSEALSRILSGNTSGHDQNESSSFSFEVHNTED